MNINKHYVPSVLVSPNTVETFERLLDAVEGANSDCRCNQFHRTNLLRRVIYARSSLREDLAKGLWQ